MLYNLYFRTMKQCLQCDRTYSDDSLNYCLDDGSRLAPASGASESPTAVFPTPVPISRDEGPQQDIQFCETADGVRIAYAVSGSGPLLVRVLGHFTHLEMEWEWPDLRHFWQELARRFTVVRYDGRGIGLSEKYAGEFTEEARQLDLHAVLNRLDADKATLLGISEGGWTAAAYVNEHPARVGRLILYGSYCRGAKAR